VKVPVIQKIGIIFQILFSTKHTTTTTTTTHARMTRKKKKKKKKEKKQERRCESFQISQQQ